LESLNGQRTAPSAPLPIGVVLPTRNAAALLPAHLAAMRAWLPHVQEMVVVDSESRDGTRDLLHAALDHPRLRWLDHPPGLYQSWNFGIRQVEAEFCYISTVGETITLEGLRHLSEVMREFACDVVVSRPQFISAKGQPMPPSRWPVHDLIETLGVSQPVALRGEALFVFTLLNFRDAILGSSASNLYRTATLQRYPFPTDYGTVGDGAWGLQNCLRIVLGITPEIFSTFREHPKSYAKAEYAVDRLRQKMLEEIRRTFEDRAALDPVFAAAAARLEVGRMFELLAGHLAAQERLEAARASGWPWIFRPAAWSARRRRRRLERELEGLKRKALGLIATGQISSPARGNSFR
jgi:glycosyltransferase involved in cell wall biosynthesis